ncbi:MAG: hypothetical protein R3E08_00105 [Thiotrichaceae bacterium]
MRQLSCLIVGILIALPATAQQDMRQLQQTVKKAEETKLSENSSAKFAGGSLTLTEVVKIALSSSPNILMQKLARTVRRQGLE